MSGSPGVRALFGPGYFNTDMSISKKFRFGERASLSAIVSAFNIWNHPNFLIVPNQSGAGAGDISNTLFGQSQMTVQPNNTGTGARVMQFALKVEF